MPSAMHQMFERGLNEDDIGELQEMYINLATRTEIALRDFEKGILVAPGDVGVGISQMVPVIVAALRKQGGVSGRSSSLSCMFIPRSRLEWPICSFGLRRVISTSSHRERR